MNLDQVLLREIRAINRLLADHGVDAGTRVENTLIAGGSFVAYELLLGQGVRIDAISKLMAELSEVLSKGRGAPCPVRLRFMPLALEVPHPMPAPLHWKKARLGGLLAGSMLAGKSYNADGSADELIALDASPHVLVAGITGSGKSVLANMLVLSLALTTSPDDLDIWVIDLKNEDLQELADLPHVSAVASDRASAAAMVRKLHALKDQRVAEGRGDFRRTLLVIDELAELAGVPGVLDLLGSIVAVGRSKRINVIACTQKPTAAVVGSIAKANFTTRLVGRVADATEAATATGRRDTGAELLPGRGAFLRIEGPEVVRFQAYYLDQAGVDYLVGWCRERWGGVRRVEHRQPAHVVVPAGLPVAMNATAPVVRAPGVNIPHELARVFAEYVDGGELRRGGMAAAMRALYGPDAPTGGRAHQEASREVIALLTQWQQAAAHVGR